MNRYEIILGKKPPKKESNDRFFLPFNNCNIEINGKTYIGVFKGIQKGIDFETASFRNYSRDVQVRSHITGTVIICPAEGILINLPYTAKLTWNGKEHDFFVMSYIQNEQNEYHVYSVEIQGMIDEML